jgi:hypothetical protein
MIIRSSIWYMSKLQNQKKYFNKLLEIMEKDKINAILETLDEK